MPISVPLLLSAPWPYGAICEFSHLGPFGGIGGSIQIVGIHGATRWAPAFAGGDGCVKSGTKILAKFGTKRCGEAGQNIDGNENGDQRIATFGHMSET